MSDLFTMLGSFAGGVQERASEIDDDIEKRRLELAKKGPSEVEKSRYAAEFASFTEDKKLIAKVQKAYNAGDIDKAQQLLGNYATMDDYKKALTRTGGTLYFPMPTLGDEPAFTAADYGASNNRTDNSIPTTAGKMLDSFLGDKLSKDFGIARKDIHEQHLEEDKPKVTPAMQTSYRRKFKTITNADGSTTEVDLNTRTAEEQATTKEHITSRYEDIQLSTAHDNKKDELTTVIPDPIPGNEGLWLEVSLRKNSKRTNTGDTDLDKAVAKVGGTVNVFSGYSVYSSKRIEQAGDIPAGTPLEFIRTGIIVDKNDNIIKDQDTLITMINGENENGLRLANVKVTAMRTGNNNDKVEMANGKIWLGWGNEQISVIPLDKVAKKDRLIVLKQNKDLTVDGKSEDLLTKTEYTLHLTEDGSTGDIAKTLGLNKDGNYIYSGYYVSNQDDKYAEELGKIQEWIEQQWIYTTGSKKGTIAESPYDTAGLLLKNVEYLDVTFSAKFTGEEEDSITHFENHRDAYTEKGWKLRGRNIEDITAATDDRTESSKKLTEQADRIMTNSKYLNYDQVLTHMNIVDDDGEPLELNMDIARIMAERFNALDITIDGNVVDKFMAQFDTPTPLYELAPEGWSNLTPKQVQKYSLGYFGKVPETKYYNKMEKAKHYMSWINAKARTWANSYYMDEADAVSVVERLALLGVQYESGNRDNNHLWFNQFGTVHRHPTKNIEYSLDDLFAQARTFKNLDSQRNRTWHQSLTKFFEAINVDEDALEAVRADFHRGK